MEEDIQKRRAELVAQLEKEQGTRNMLENALVQNTSNMATTTGRIMECDYMLEALKEKETVTETE
jgi:hypothetical protein